VLEVNGDRAPPPVEHEMAFRVRAPAADPVRTVDADDIGAHVGQQHARERPRADGRHLDDAHAGQGAGGRRAQCPVHTGAHLCANAAGPAAAATRPKTRVLVMVTAAR
jgi:hypothetical protein